jgi:hypothetical protein
VIANGIQSPVLSQPGVPATALSRGIQNKVAAYSDSAAVVAAEAALAAATVNVYTADPTADLAARGQIIIVKTPGQPSIAKVCVETSAGGYEWIGVAQSS